MSFIPPAFTPAQATLDRRRIAVLPLQNLSPDPNDEYFADGMTEELISAISNVSGLSVISRTSIMQYKKPSKKLAQIGEDLGAGTILEGSVRKAGNKIRVAVQLIEVKEDKHLWAQNYDRELQDVFAIQSDIAERVARALEVKVLGEERHRLDGRGSKNTEAVALYIKGRSHFNERTEASVRRAIECFEQAGQLDPDFALAYVGLADCYYWLQGPYMSHAEGMAKAKEDLDKALALNPDLGEAHASLGSWFTQMSELRWEEAEDEFRKALELSPSYAPAHYQHAALLAWAGKLDQALYEARKAQELDPVDPATGLRVGMVLYYRREYDQAIEQYKQVLRLQPNLSWPLWWMAFAYIGKGMNDEALNAALKWKEQVADFPSAPGWTKAMLSLLHAAAGRKEEAERLMKEAAAQSSSGERSFPTILAYWYTAMGDIDLAFEYLEKAYEARDEVLLDIKVEPLWDPIRSDPRYTGLLQKLHMS